MGVGGEDMGVGSQREVAEKRELGVGERWQRKGSCESERGGRERGVGSQREVA